MNDSNSADERARFEEVLQRKVNSYLDCGDAAGADFESSCSGEDFGSMPGTPRKPDEKRCQVVEDILERMEIPFDQRQRLPWRCLLQDLEVEEIFTPRREGAKYCAVCYKWMNGERQWYEHVHGKSHKKKTGKSTSKQVTVPKKPPGSPDAQGSVVGFDNAHAPDSMTSTPLEEKKWYTAQEHTARVQQQQCQLGSARRPLQVGTTLQRLGTSIDLDSRRSEKRIYFPRTQT